MSDKRLSIYELFGYCPTEFQMAFHRKRREQTYTTTVAHRRFGKTEQNLLELLEGALTCEKRLPIYQYIAPSLKQAKKIAWDKLKYYVSVARNNGLRCITVSESESKIVFTHRGASNPSTIELCGWEEPESLRGPYSDGVVIDEAADMKRGIWGKIIAPRLADRKGWASITGTVKGLDQFFDFYRKGVPGEEKDPNWGSLYFPISVTTGKIPWLDAAALATLKSGMTDTEWRQEMELDWNANNDNCLISLDVIDAAMKRELPDEGSLRNFACVAGLDVARFGDDPNTLTIRRGDVVYPFRDFRRIDGERLALEVVKANDQYELDACFVDGTGGYGASVVDALRRLHAPFPVYEIKFNEKALDDNHYFNKRAEMYDLMRNFLEREGCVPESELLRRCLNAPQYDYVAGRLKLEDKKEIRKRLGRSTDAADSLALTFALPVYPRKKSRFFHQGNFVRNDFAIE